MQNLTVSQEDSEKKRDQCVDKKRGFIAPRINSFSLRICHHDWKTCFSRLLVLSARVRLFPGLSGKLHLQLVAASAKRTC